LLIASIAIPSLISSLGDNDLVGSAHHLRQLKSNPYEDILEELDGAHLRFAASHLSLIHPNIRIYFIMNFLNVKK